MMKNIGLIIFLSICFLSKSIGQRHSIFVTGGTALFNTTIGVSYQFNIINAQKHNIGLEVKYGRRSDLNIVREKDNVSFTYYTAAAVSKVKVNKTGYFESNVGVSRVTKTNFSKNEIEKYNRLYLAFGFVWKLTPLNLRLGLSSQEMLHVGIGWSF